MAKFIYNIEQLEVQSLNQPSKITVEEKELIGTFEVNSLFTPNGSNVELNVYGVDNTLLEHIPNFTDFSFSLNAQSAGKSGASVLTLDPVADIKKLNYDTGDVRLLYRFTNNLYSESQVGGKLFIESISPDGTEIRALSTEVSDEKLREYTNTLKEKLQNSNHISEFNLNFGDNKLGTGLNIDLEETKNGLAVAIKLYEPLNISVNEKFFVEENISDDILYEITTVVQEDVIKVPFLKGPNFSIDSTDDSSQPTEYLNYNELFSYPVSNSYFELYSLFNEKSAEIAIDYSSFENFIHFSSAEERLRNFHYKLQLIESYEEAIGDLNTDASGSSNPYLTTTTGSKESYENLITGIINNFDHYDRYLYFESSSTAWPKTTTKRPHVNYDSSHPSASAWLESTIVDANNFDASNFDILTNTIPTFIREDSNNEQYQMFIHMIAHHFDNLWIYFKAVSDKYDTDHRLNFGVSKDLVRDAIESFGVKLYNSNQSKDNLFATFVGENLSTGSERIVSTSLATSASFNSGSTALEHLQPVAKNNYEKEIYKRIYHNLPFLMKAKGTERGLRALVNCFGIPKEILTIKTFGGNKTGEEKFFGPEHFQTSSLYNSGSNQLISGSDKLRLDNTGSIVSGSTLSRYVSIVKSDKKYTDDLPHVEVGFNISRGTDEFIDFKISSSFSIDDYIGDPRNVHEEGYSVLTSMGKNIVNDGYHWNDISDNWEKADFKWDDALSYSKSPKGFIRLLNFFDSSLFKLIKDFVPARAKVDTGVIIKSHKLARSKAKQVEASWESLTETGSVSIGTTTGSHGGAFNNRERLNFTTNYDKNFISPIGSVPRNITDESPMFTGEFSGSLLISTDGEVSSNNSFKKINQPPVSYKITAFNLSAPLPPGCLILITGSYTGEYLIFNTSGSGTVGVSYPVLEENSSSSINYTVNFDDYEYVAATATTGTGDAFRGWYADTSGSTLITENNNLTIYYIDENVYGNSYHAYFEDITYFISSSGNGQVDATYPTTASVSNSGIEYINDFEEYSTFTLEATATYPSVFEGWYNVASGGSPLTTSTTLTVTKAYINTNGRTIYARFI